MFPVMCTKRIIISHPDGDIYRCWRSDEEEDGRLSEVYVSKIKPKCVKAWKKHNEMTMRLVCPVGSVRFVFAVHRDTGWDFSEHIIGEDAYDMLIVQPGVVFGFQSVCDYESTVINLSNILHREEEVTRYDRSEIPFEW